MKRCFLLCILVVLTGAGLACRADSAHRGRESKSRLPAVDAATAQRACLKSDQLDEASNLHTAKCLRCHKPYDPRSYSESQWQTWMSKMSRKARLDTAQEDLLSRYLKAVRDTSRAEQIETNR